MTGKKISSFRRKDLQPFMTCRIFFRVQCQKRIVKIRRSHHPWRFWQIKNPVLIHVQPKTLVFDGYSLHLSKTIPHIPHGGFCWVTRCWFSPANPSLPPRWRATRTAWRRRGTSWRRTATSTACGSWDATLGRLGCGERQRRWLISDIWGFLSGYEPCI